MKEGKKLPSFYYLFYYIYLILKPIIYVNYGKR